MQRVKVSALMKSTILCQFYEDNAVESMKRRGNERNLVIEISKTVKSFAVDKRNNLSGNRCADFFLSLLLGESPGLARPRSPSQMDPEFGALDLLPSLLDIGRDSLICTLSHS